VLALAAEGREAEVRAAVSALGELVEVVPDLGGVVVETA
jgi:hypothetical protein